MRFLLFVYMLLLLTACGKPKSHNFNPKDTRNVKEKGEIKTKKDSLVYIFKPNSTFLVNHKESAEITSAEIKITQDVINIGPYALNVVSRPQEKFINERISEFHLTTLLQREKDIFFFSPEVKVIITKRGDEIVSIQLNNQVFVSKGYYSSIQNKSVDISKDTSQYHIVVYGENLGRIGKKYQLSLEELSNLNPGMNKNIQPGQRILVK